MLLGVIVKLGGIGFNFTPIIPILTCCSDTGSGAVTLVRLQLSAPPEGDRKTEFVANYHNVSCLTEGLFPEKRLRKGFPLRPWLVELQ